MQYIFKLGVEAKHFLLNLRDHLYDNATLKCSMLWCNEHMPSLTSHFQFIDMNESKSHEKRGEFSTNSWLRL